MVLLFAQGGGAPRGAGRARQRAAARPPGRFVLGHCGGSDGAGRDFRFAAVPERPRILVLEPRAEHAREHRPGRAERATTARSDRVGNRDRRRWPATSPAIFGRRTDRRSALPAEALRQLKCLTAISPKRSSSPIGADRQIQTLGAGQSATIGTLEKRHHAAADRGARATQQVSPINSTPNRIGGADAARITARTPISTRRACSTRRLPQQIEPRQRGPATIIRRCSPNRASTSCASTPRCCSAR